VTILEIFQRNPDAVAMRRCKWRGLLRVSVAPKSEVPGTLSWRRQDGDDWVPVSQTVEDHGPVWEDVTERRAA
jgi:hypothetical protein